MRYFILKVGQTSRLVAGYAGHDLDRADRHFCEEGFETVRDYIESFGHYCCNAHDYDHSQLLDVIIDKDFIVDESDDYESMEYRRYREVLMQLLNDLVTTSPPTVQRANAHC